MSMSELIYLTLMQILIIVSCTPKYRTNHKIDSLLLESLGMKSKITLNKNIIAELTEYELKKLANDKAEAEKIRLLHSNLIPESHKIMNMNLTDMNTVNETKSLEILDVYDENSSDFLEFTEDENVRNINKVIKNPKNENSSVKLVLKQMTKVNNNTKILNTNNTTSYLNKATSKLKKNTKTYALFKDHNPEDPNTEKTTPDKNTSMKIIDILRSTASVTIPTNTQFISSKQTTKREIVPPKNNLLNILRNKDGTIVAEKVNKTCGGYEYDPTICQNIGNRLLCGYNKNTGEIKQEDFVEDLGNGCYIKGERMECGYLSGPYKDREKSPEYRNVAPSQRRQEREVGNVQQSANNSEFQKESTSSTKHPFNNGIIPKEMCVEKGDRIVCYDFETDD